MEEIEIYINGVKQLNQVAALVLLQEVMTASKPVEVKVSLGKLSCIKYLTFTEGGTIWAKNSKDDEDGSMLPSFYVGPWLKIIAETLINAKKAYASENN